MEEWIPPGTVMAPVSAARPQPGAAAEAPAVRGLYGGVADGRRPAGDRTDR